MLDSLIYTFVYVSITEIKKCRLSGQSQHSVIRRTQEKVKLTVCDRKPRLNKGKIKLKCSHYLSCKVNKHRRSNHREKISPGC